NRLPTLRSTLFPYTTLFRSYAVLFHRRDRRASADCVRRCATPADTADGGCTVVPRGDVGGGAGGRVTAGRRRQPDADGRRRSDRSEEHTSELQSLAYLVCRL